MLSAGGMFGAYQAGAWRALAGRFRPDAVIGASVGALNGWAIAGGIHPAELVAMWTDPRLAHMAKLARPPAAGLLDPAPLRGLIGEIFARYTPLVPFAATLVELPGFGLRLVRTPEITPQHLFAATAVPVGYPPVRIAGKLYVDGGLLGALPLWAAAAMGAECAVAVDALPYMPSRVIRYAVRLLRRLAPQPPAARPGDVLRIAPPDSLGSVRQAIHWDPAAITRWIDMGEADARRCFRLE